MYLKTRKKRMGECGGGGGGLDEYRIRIGGDYRLYSNGINVRRGEEDMMTTISCR